MKSQYDYDIIRDYLHGLVDKQTATEIGELIKKDEIARGIAEGILRLDKEFKEDDVAIDTFLENLRQKQLTLIHQYERPVRITKKLWFRIAASLLLLVIAGFAISMVVFAPDYHAQIDAELAQPYPISNLFRSESESSPQEKGYQLYTQGDYAGAIRYLEQVSSEDKDIASVTFYNALSNLYSGKYNRASVLFESHNIGNSRYSDQAQWYRALALIKADNKNKAIEVLTAITGDKLHFKREAALELLDELE
jgi:hypothetical protein